MFLRRRCAILQARAVPIKRTFSYTTNDDHLSRVDLFSSIYGYEYNDFTAGIPRHAYAWRDTIDILDILVSLLYRASGDAYEGLRRPKDHIVHPVWCDYCRKHPFAQLGTCDGQYSQQGNACLIIGARRRNAIGSDRH